jgi:hypothetical protein
MNKAVNIFSVFILGAFTLLSLTIVYDLAISNLHLKAMPYKKEVLYGIAILYFLVGLLRVKGRWQGARDMKGFSQFAFESSISKTFKKRSFTFTFIEILFTIGAMLVFYKMALLEFEMMIAMIVVLAILLLEAVIYLIKVLIGGKSFRVGLNDEIIAYFGREMKLYYFDSLQRVELHQSDLISFKYKGDLVMFMPTDVLEDEEKVKFRDTLISILEKKNIYFDDRFRNWK